MSSRVILIAAACMAALAAVVVAVGGGARQTADSPIAHRHTTNVEVQFAADFTDPRRVAGYADDVFFGQVVRKAGEARGPSAGDARVRTTYDVRVLDRLKGTVAGTVKVSQLGGVDEQGRVVLFEEDPLLEVGGIYLLATLTNGDERLALARFGTLPVPDEHAYKKLKPRFDDAVADQIPAGRAKEE